MVRQRRIGIGLLEGAELPVFDVSRPEREAFADQVRWCADKISTFCIYSTGIEDSMIVSGKETPSGVADAWQGIPDVRVL